MDDYFKVCYRVLFFGWVYVNFYLRVSIFLGFSCVGLFDGKIVMEEETKRILGIFKGILNRR